MNRTGGVVSYELRGGPHMMTLSECDLDPEETEVWESPYRHPLDLRIRIEIGALLLEKDVVERSVVTVVADGDSFRLDIA